MKPVVISLGTGAGKALSWFNKSVWDDDQPVTIALDADLGELDSLDTHRTRWLTLGDSLIEGSEDRTPDGSELVQRNWNSLQGMLEKYNPVVLLVALGGTFGTEAAPTLARLLHSEEKDVLSVAGRPFGHESVIDERSIESSIRRLRLYSDQTFVLDTSKLSQYLAQSEIKEVHLHRMLDQLYSNLLFYVFRAFFYGEEVDPEAYDRICRMNSVQKQNLIMNSFAPGWHRDRQDGLDESASVKGSEKSEAYDFWFIRMFYRIQEWIIRIIRKLAREIADFFEHDPLVIKTAVMGKEIELPIA